MNILFLGDVVGKPGRIVIKYFLDNYVIHHANGEDRAIENPWKLQYYYKKGNKAAYLKDLYDDNKVQQNEVIQLLSMFEVAFTPKQRKNYLFYCLYHLFEDCDLNDYVDFLRKLADKYFFDVYLDTDKLAYSGGYPFSISGDIRSVPS